jgi:hypothetical protein
VAYLGLPGCLAAMGLDGKATGEMQNKCRQPEISSRVSFGSCDSAQLLRCSGMLRKRGCCGSDGYSYCSWNHFLCSLPVIHQLITTHACLFNSLTIFLAHDLVHPQYIIFELTIHTAYQKQAASRAHYNTSNIKLKCLSKAYPTLSRSRAQKTTLLPMKILNLYISSQI